MWGISVREQSLTGGRSLTGAAVADRLGFGVSPSDGCEGSGLGSTVQGRGWRRRRDSIRTRARVRGTGGRHPDMPATSWPSGSGGPDRSRYSASTFHGYASSVGRSTQPIGGFGRPVTRRSAFWGSPWGPARNWHAGVAAGVSRELGGAPTRDHLMRTIGEYGDVSALKKCLKLLIEHFSDSGLVEGQETARHLPSLLVGSMVEPPP